MFARSGRGYVVWPPGSEALTDGAFATHEIGDAVWGCGDVNTGSVTIDEDVGADEGDEGEDEDEDEDES
ncbi:unnamed protein product [Diplocarpon coronariae]